MSNFTTWRKSSRSAGNGGECVELAHAGEVAGVRDSKNPGGPVLTFGPAELTQFLNSIKAGRFTG